MEILSLKSVLLYQLGRSLLGEAKADAIRFNDFLYASTKSRSALDKPSMQKLLDWYEIPLQRKQQTLQSTSQVLYVSALPQAIASSSCTIRGAAASASWKEVVNRLNQSRYNSKAKLTSKQRFCSFPILSIETLLWLEFEIETQKAGWIAFNLTKKGIDKWLQTLCLPPSRPALRRRNRPTTNASQVERFDPSTAELLWQAQYTYTCCIQLESRQSPSINRALKEEPLEQTACDRSYHPATGPQHDHSAEVSLIRALIDTSDSLFWIPYRRPTQQYLLLLKRVSPLCRAFEHFRRACLSGFKPSEVASAAPAIAQQTQHARLIRATKNTLKVLLEEHLCEQAPKKL